MCEYELACLAAGFDLGLAGPRLLDLDLGVQLRMVYHFLCHQGARELSVDVTSEKSDRNAKVDNGQPYKD